MPLTPQDNSGGEGNVTQDNSAATFPASNDNDITEVEGLKNEVNALKIKCDMLEKTVSNLQSVCGTHQKTLEAFRQQIINLHVNQGTLDLSYQGELFEATCHRD
jgi:hypothetical protein